MSRKCFCWSAMTQISTSVKERTEDVALTPRAGTLWVASSVLVNEDTPEMESSAEVGNEVDHHHHH